MTALKSLRLFVEGLTIGAILCLLFLIVVAPAASAQEQQIVASVPLTERIPATGHTAPDSVHLVSTTPVAPENQGGRCDVQVTGMNNDSVHPNSDILVASENTVTIADVEREANVAVLPADRELVLGDAVTVSVRLGQDGLFSGGTLVVEFSCTSPPPPTTTTAATTTTTAVTTTTMKSAPPTTVCTPATPGGICSLPKTGGRSNVDVVVGLVCLGVGVGSLLSARQWVLDRRQR